MKKDINSKLLLVTAATSLLGFTNCGKYEDGPSISLMSKTGRLTGEWEVKEYDGDDLPSGSEITFEFEKDGDFEVTQKYSYTNYYGQTYSNTNSYEGEWEWEKDKEEIELQYDGISF